MSAARGHWCGMANDLHGMDRFVLQEFRLADGASHAAAARILAALDERGVPLLTSISDDRDVAFVRCVTARDVTGDDPLDRAALRGLVAHWQDHRIYRPSVAESSLRPPTGYRLAVTESGFNDGPRSVPGGRQAPDGPDAPTLISLLWIGTPADSFTGLFVLVGQDGVMAEAQATDWPLPLSEQLGVRVYRG